VLFVWESWDLGFKLILPGILLAFTFLDQNSLVIKPNDQTDLLNSSLKTFSPKMLTHQYVSSPPMLLLARSHPMPSSAPMT